MMVGPDTAIRPGLPLGCGTKVSGSTIASEEAMGTPTEPCFPSVSMLDATPTGGCEIGICSVMEYVEKMGI